MSKTKYAVEFAGQTFTRTTARTYSHIVVAKNSKAKALHWASVCTDVNAQYMVDHALGKAPVYSWQTPEDIAKYVAKGNAILAIGMDAHQAQYKANSIAEIERYASEGAYDKYVIQGWCGRADLAQKLAGSLGDSWVDVQIVEVK